METKIDISTYKDLNTEYFFCNPMQLEFIKESATTQLFFEGSFYKLDSYEKVVGSEYYKFTIKPLK